MSGEHVETRPEGTEHLGEGLNERVQSKRLSSFAHLIEESKFFIEWTAMDTGIERAAELVELQVQLAPWQLNWSSIWADDAKRRKVAEQVKVWSDRVLEMSGLLSESVTSG